MKKVEYKFYAKVWLYPGAAAWCFVSLPTDDSEKIKRDYAPQKRAWGSIPVSVTVGRTSWRTSIFPDKRSGTFLLPLKAEIRKKENIFIDDELSVVLRVAL